MKIFGSNVSSISVAGETGLESIYIKVISFFVLSNCNLFNLTLSVSLNSSIFINCSSVSVIPKTLPETFSSVSVNASCIFFTILITSLAPPTGIILKLFSRMRFLK